MAIAAGYFHSLALHSDGTVAAWVSPEYEVGSNYVSVIEAVPADPTNAVAVRAGAHYSLALRAGLCLEVHDLACSKLVAGREKDLDFVGAVLRHKLAHPEVIEQRLSSSPLTEELRAICRGRLDRLNK